MITNPEKFLVFDSIKATQEWEQRFYLMIELCSPRRGGITFLASKTGISDRRWKNVLMTKQKPAIDMALALAWLRPELALWMWTGSTNGSNVAPSASEIALIQEARLTKRRRSTDTPTLNWWDENLPVELENAYKNRELVRKSQEEMLAERELQDDAKDKVSKSS
jgi:hypothetical protein